MRTCGLGLLAAVLVLTGHSMAVARGMPSASGYSAYCIGENTTMVPVDAAGEPVGPPHICPEFSLSLLDWVVEAQVDAQPLVSTSKRIVIRQSTKTHVLQSVPATARAPPLFL